METKLFRPMALALAALLLRACLMPAPAAAQNLAVSTNAADYANFGTLNLEASFSVARQWTLTAGTRYNPFHFKLGDDAHDVNNRQRMFAAGARFWPWHVYSGWWFAGKLQYQEYNVGGFRTPETEEGDRYGFGATVGYTYMLARHFNLEFGLGGWLGYNKYVTYDCPVCGFTTDRGDRFFILPNDIVIAVSYIF